MPINGDMITPGVAITFGPGPENQTISQGIVIGSTGDTAVKSSQNQSTLDNFGVVFNQTSNPAVDFTGAAGLIINEAGATISSDSSGFFLSGGTGIHLNGNGDTILNFGGIFGLGGFFSAGIVFDTNSINAQLINHGSVAGIFSGIAINSHHDGGVVRNFGSISAPIIGVNVNSLHGLTTNVTNAKGATITAKLDAISVTTGAINLVNAGTLAGTVFCGDGTASDNIVNIGKIHGSVFLSGAFDFFNGKKGTSGDISTGAGHDIVQVGKGKVSIHINDAGHSTVTAGAGPDKFVFDNGLGGGRIVIKHFSAAIDHIVLSETFFHGLGPLGKLHGNHFAIDGNAGNGLPQIVYNSHTGVLSYDSNGEFHGGQTPFAILAGDPPISHATFLLEA